MNDEQWMKRLSGLLGGRKDFSNPVVGRVLVKEANVGEGTRKGSERLMRRLSH